MNLTIVDLQEIFSLDISKWKINVNYIGNSKNKIVEIKNFFEHPDKVKNYANSVQYVNAFNDQRYSVPGYVHEICNYVQDLIIKKILDEVCLNFSPQTSFSLDHSHRFTFQAYSKNTECKISSIYPHTDRCRYSAVCSLNEDSDYDGDDNGTSFWRNTETLEEYATCDYNYRQLGYLKSVSKGYTDLDPSKTISLGWKKYHLQKHSYNTFIMYEGNLWHSPYFDKTKWNTERLTFNCFLK